SVVRAHRRVSHGDRAAVSAAAAAGRSPIMKGVTKPAARVRIDRLLVERGLVESREQAARLILAGEVLLAGKRVSKAGAPVARDAGVAPHGRPAFVGRGGRKPPPPPHAFPPDAPRRASPVV